MKMLRDAATASVLLCGLALAGAALFAHGSQAAEPSQKGATMLVHNVYFSLKNPSPAASAKLVAACEKYLSKHPGTVFFAAGTVSDLDRPVNDRDFDVGLHIVFDSRAAHDTYQDAPLHLQFIEENKGDWAKVRVFDTDAKGGCVTGASKP